MVTLTAITAIMAPATPATPMTITSVNFGIKRGLGVDFKNRLGTGSRFRRRAFTSPVWEGPQGPRRPQRVHWQAKRQSKRQIKRQPWL